MLRSRIIPSLLLSGSGLIKTKAFKRYKYIGDVINAIKIFNEKEVDELCLYDVDATTEGRAPNFELLKLVAKESNMPLTYGGGVKTIGDAEKLISLGFEKISISSAALETPQLISEISRTIGRQSTVVTLDVKKSFLGKYNIYKSRGTEKIAGDFWQTVQQLEEQGMGELIINMVELDGTRSGYDIPLAQKLKSKLKVPLTMLGGAASIESIDELVQKCGPIGAAAGSLFVFKGRLDAVLINYDRPKQQ